MASGHHGFEHISRDGSGVILDTVCPKNGGALKAIILPAYAVISDSGADPVQFHRTDSSSMFELFVGAGGRGRVLLWVRVLRLRFRDHQHQKPSYEGRFLTLEGSWLGRSRARTR